MNVKDIKSENKLTKSDASSTTLYGLRQDVLGIRSQSQPVETLVGEISTLDGSVYASVPSSILPASDLTYNIGSSTLSWLGVYAGTYYDSSGNSLGSFKIISTPSGTSPTADLIYDTLTISSTGGTLTITGTATTDTVNFDVAIDGIDDTHIDWGTGANQVSALDLPITDSGAYYTGSTVEDALQEIGAGTTLGGSFLKLDGSNGPMTGNLSLGAFTLTAHAIKADASDGVLVEAGNGTDVAILGAGNTANALFYGSVNITGDLTVTGDDIFMTTNTANYFLMADGTNYNPTSPADARTGLGLVAGGTGDIWVEKAGDTMTGALNISLASGNSLIVDTSTLVVDATNDRVGVGTASPAVKLHVNGSTNGDVTLRVQNATSGTAARAFAQFTNDTPANGYLMVTSSAYTGVSGWADRFVFNSDTTLTGGILIRPGAGGFQVSASGTNNADLYVDTGGDVGVGTTSPTSDLHIIRASATMTVEASSGGVNLTADAIAGNANFNFNSKSSTTGTGNQGQFNFNAYVDGAGSAVSRWIMLKTSTQESGSNAGSNFSLLKRTDAGGSLGNPAITIERSTGYIGINRAEATATVQLDVVGDGMFTGNLSVDQSSTTGAKPVLILDQADVSEEFISFLATIGTGNSIEAVGAKTLTTTHFIKVKIQGGLIRYFPVGTIA